MKTIGFDYIDTDSIGIYLSNNTMYLFNITDIDFEDLCVNIDKIKNNLETAEHMLYDIMRLNDENCDIVAIDELMVFAENLGVKLDYTNIRPDMSKHEIAMLSCFDVIKIHKTFIDVCEKHALMKTLNTINKTSILNELSSMPYCDDMNNIIADINERLGVNNLLGSRYVSDVLETITSMLNKNDNLKISQEEIKYGNNQTKCHDC